MLERITREEFPYHGEDYGENIYVFLSGAYEQLRIEGYRGEPIDHPWVKNPLKYLEISKQMYDLRQLMRESSRLPTQEELNMPLRRVA